MQKFFVKSNQINNDNIDIIGDDVNHIINVLRLGKDDEVQVCNSETAENYITKIQEYDKEMVKCHIIEKLENTVESNIKIDLYQGLPKADKMELIIQKTTELGVTSIYPVQTKRAIVKLEGKDEKKKIERWQKISEVAAKQSKRDIIPEIGNKISINQLKDKVKQYDVFIVPYEEEKSQNLKCVLKQLKSDNKRIGIFIGPEGGIAPEEIEILKNEGAKIITLGKRILRTETAPIVTISNILYELEE